MAVIPDDQAQLWWAGKELLREKLLSDFVGRNEKTKLIVKIQKVYIMFPAQMSVFVFVCVMVCDGVSVSVTV